MFQEDGTFIEILFNIAAEAEVVNKVVSSTAINKGTIF